MDITRDIHPISYLKRKTAQLLDQLEETGEPVILTQRSGHALVVDLTNKSGKCSGSRATPYQPA